MGRRAARSFLGGAAIVALGFVATVPACTTSRVARDPMGAITDFSPGDRLMASESVGCESTFERYCDALFSPGAMGNLRIGSGPGSFTVYRGKTANGFSATFYFYANAKLRRQAFLPKDFRRKLAAQGYFDSLQEFLGRKPRSEMSLSDRSRDLRNQHYLDALWRSAIEETVLARMERVHPGFHRLKESFVPVELQIRRSDTRRHLVSEISTALWQNHRNWQKVTRSFESVRARFLELVEEMDLDQEWRRSWRQRLESVRLIVPGSIPDVADEECSTTDTNAYYYPHLNALTVCAGDFNSEDIYQTIAHELAHAIDFDSQLLMFRGRTRLAARVGALADWACGKPAMGCEDWTRFKGELPELLEEWSSFEPPMERFQRCLKPKATPVTADRADLARISEEAIADALSSLADNNVFVKLTKERLPYPDGAWKPNPLFQDACKFLPPRRSSDPTDAESIVLAFFLAEYRCSGGEDAARLRSSIIVARRMAAQLLGARLAMEREFSSIEELVQRGLAASPTERFADVLGSHALARVLREKDSLWERRKRFLASSAWQCSRPSLSKAFPAEAEIERELLFDAHTGGKDRVRESFSAPIREALSCSKDFVFNECVLPMRERG